MTNNVQIGIEGIKKLLKNVSFTRAITEYVWNGIDAGANQIDITIDYNEGGMLKTLSIKDDGSGIDYDQLRDKFLPFYESEKVSSDNTTRNHSLPHGKNGFGRLTFYKFAHRVKWTTIFSKNQEFYRYSIFINSSDLNEYKSEPEDHPEKVNEPTGTLVEFAGFEKFMHEKEYIDQIFNYLKVEFAWFIKLKPSVVIKVNNKKIDASDLEEIFEELTWKIRDSSFKIRYVQWKNISEGEYSRYYYLKENGKELFKEHTGLNKQGDGFFHSVYISSKYFETFDFKSINPSQTSLVGKVRSDEVFKELQKKLNYFLRKKRKPFLKGKSEKLVEGYVEEGIISEEPKDEFKQLKVEELKKTVKEMYEAQPQIFLKLNTEQKRAVIGLLKLLLDSEERERILDIILQITELTPDERKELEKVLKRSGLSSIIKTINMLQRRSDQIELLKQIVYRDELNAKEVEHLQQIVENNLWIFGEEYNLHGDCETDFKQILEEVRKIIFKDGSIMEREHPESKRQVDMFLIKQEITENSKNLLIVELKKPKIKLDYDEITQIKRYRDNIIEQPQLNAKNLNWKVILVGRQFGESNSIVNEREKFKHQGELGLIDHINNTKLFIVNWSEIINNFEIKHKFLLKDLEIKKDTIVNKLKTADEVVEKSNLLSKYSS